MSLRLRLFLWLVDRGAPLAATIIRADTIGICNPTRLGRVVARILCIWPQRIRWDVER